MRLWSYDAIEALNWVIKADGVILDGDEGEWGEDFVPLEDVNESMDCDEAAMRDRIEEGC